MTFAKRLILFLTAMFILREAMASYYVAVKFVYTDKLVHVFAFYVLALLADLSFPEKKFVVTNIAGLLLFGAAIEVLQRYTTFRDFSMLDMAANIVGISLFYLTAPFLKKMPRLGRIWQPATEEPVVDFTVAVADNNVRLDEMELRGSVIPETLAEECRYLNRSRRRLLGEEEKLQNRIRALLEKYDYRMPPDLDGLHWSGASLRWLEHLRFPDRHSSESQVVLLDGLKQKRGKLAEVLRNMRYMVRKQPMLDQAVSLIETVPGVGFLTVYLFLTEIVAANRFTELVVFIDLVLASRPFDGSSFSDDSDLSLYEELLSLLENSSNRAVGKEPVLTKIFGALCGRMETDAAVTGIAKILLGHISSGWQNQQPFSPEGIVVEPGI